MDEELVRSSIEEAARDASLAPLEQLTRTVAEVLKKQDTPSLESTKKPLRTKKRLRTCSYYICDSCDQPILKEEDGFVIQGNIYVADPTCRGGLIGNNFPEHNTFPVDEVLENVFCYKCLMEILGLHKRYLQPVPKFLQDSPVESPSNTDALRNPRRRR
jgi:hypothetical protein